MRLQETFSYPRWDLGTAQASSQGVSLRPFDDPGFPDVIGR